MRQSLTQVTTVELSRAIATSTNEHLRSAGSRREEGLALWAGKQDGALFTISHLIVPEQIGVSSENGIAVMVSPDELRRVTLLLHAEGIRILAQIHSHPGDAYHSAMDDEYAIATALGAFSIVVPDFAVRPFHMGLCATYRLTARPWWSRGDRPRWTKVDRTKAAQIFSIKDE